VDGADDMASFRAEGGELSVQGAIGCPEVCLFWFESYCIHSILSMTVPASPPLRLVS